MAEDWFDQQLKQAPAPKQDWFDQQLAERAQPSLSSALARGAGAFWENANPLNAIKPIIHLMSWNPEVQAGAAKSLAGAIAPGVMEPEPYGPGNALNLLHAVPFVGPPSAQIGSEIGGGQYAEAAGHTAGLLASLALGKWITKMNGPKPIPTETPGMWSLSPRGEAWLAAASPKRYSVYKQIQTLREFPKEVTPETRGIFGLAQRYPGRPIPPVVADQPPVWEGVTAPQGLVTQPSVEPIPPTVTRRMPPPPPKVKEPPIWEGVTASQSPAAQPPVEPIPPMRTRRMPPSPPKTEPPIWEGKTTAKPVEVASEVESIKPTQARRTPPPPTKLRQPPGWEGKTAPQTVEQPPVEPVRGPLPSGRKPGKPSTPDFSPEAVARELERGKAAEAARKAEGAGTAASEQQGMTPPPGARPTPTGADVAAEVYGDRVMASKQLHALADRLLAEKGTRGTTSGGAGGPVHKYVSDLLKQRYGLKSMTEATVEQMNTVADELAREYFKLKPKP